MQFYVILSETINIMQFVASPLDFIINAASFNLFWAYMNTFFPLSSDPTIILHLTFSVYCKCCHDSHCLIRSLYKLLMTCSNANLPILASKKPIILKNVCQVSVLVLCIHAANPWGNMLPTGWGLIYGTNDGKLLHKGTALSSWGFPSDSSFSSSSSSSVSSGLISSLLGCSSYSFCMSCHSAIGAWYPHVGIVIRTWHSSITHNGKCPLSQTVAPTISVWFQANIDCFHSTVLVAGTCQSTNQLLTISIIPVVDWLFLKEHCPTKLFHFHSFCAPFVGLINGKMHKCYINKDVQWPSSAITHLSPRMFDTYPM